MSRWPFDRRDTRESCKSIDIRRWHREGRLRVGQQFPYCRYACGAGIIGIDIFAYI
jgi:hypothetical protein